MTPADLGSAAVIADERIAIGTRVKATRNPDLDREYNEIARLHRVRHSGEEGHVCAASDDHGLCYQVNFSGGAAWYEPSELKRLDKDDDARAAMVRQCCDALCRIATEARETASAFDDAVGAFTYGKDTFEEKCRRLTDAMADRVRAEARLAGARQLAEALGLVAKVTP